MRAWEIADRGGVREVKLCCWDEEVNRGGGPRKSPSTKLYTAELYLDRLIDRIVSNRQKGVRIIVQARV